MERSIRFILEQDDVTESVINGFFSTRENLHIGPFTSRDEVDVELFFYLKCLGTVSSDAGIPASFKSIRDKR